MGLLRDLGGWHFLIILAIVLLIFGATRLPALARSLGQSAKILRNEFRGDETSAAVPEQNTPAPAAQGPVAPAPAPPASSVPAPVVPAPVVPQLNVASAQPVGEPSPTADQR